jgi:hypothetical protein
MEAVNEKTGEVYSEHLVVYAPQEYRTGNTIKTRWIRLGAGFLSKERTGYNIILNALPLPDPRDGRVKLHMRPPFPKEEEAEADKEGRKEENCGYEELSRYSEEINI